MKLIVAGLAACAALFFLYMMIGPRMESTAFTVSDHPVSYLMLAGVGLGFVFWRVVKGK